MDIKDIKRRALLSRDADEIAKIMDEADPFSYDQATLFELMQHLRAALYTNLVKLFKQTELDYSADSVAFVNQLTGELRACLDEKNNILPELPEDMNNLFTWLASVEGKMDIYEPRTQRNIIKRYVDYAGGYIAEVYKEMGFIWAPCTDGDAKFVLKQGDVEIALPSDSVFKQLVYGETNKVIEVFDFFMNKLKTE